MFGSKKTQDQLPQDAAQQPAAPSGYSDVYVMPEKYVVQTAKGGGKGLLIASIILIAVILLTGSYFIYDLMNRQPLPVTPAVIPPQVEIPSNEPPLESEITATTTMEIATTTPATTTVATTTQPAAPTPVSPSLDTDSDSLTNIEETVLGTLPTNPDSDGDGYKDGVEVAAGYNPTKPGSSKLNESPFMVSLSTSFDADNFKILYPKDWQVSLIKASKQVLVTAATGELIRISIKENQLGQSVLAWYLQDHPEALVSQLRVVEAGTLTGVFSPNGLTAYLTDAARAKFYIFEYLLGQQTELRYPTIFGAIIKSLTLIQNTPPPVAIATTTPASQSCVGYMCAEEPCGPLVSGQNSCLSPTLKSTCYDKVCTQDSECPTGQICVEISCWSGDTAEIAKVCK